MTRRVIRTDGTEVPLDRPQSTGAIRKLIGADTLSTVILRHLGQPMQVMLVDDTGIADGKPINPKASALYWKNCRPGTIHPICGDVAIVFDDDFGGRL